MNRRGFFRLFSAAVTAAAAAATATRAIRVKAPMRFAGPTPQPFNPAVLSRLERSALTSTIEYQRAFNRVQSAQLETMERAMALMGENAMPFKVGDTVRIRRPARFVTEPDSSWPGWPETEYDLATITS